MSERLGRFPESELLKNNLTGLSAEKSFSIINNYLHAFQKVFEEIDEEIKDIIIKTVIFQGILKASPYIIQKTLAESRKLTCEAFYNVLVTLKTTLSKQNIIRPGKSYLAFADTILEAITKVHIQPSIITED